MERCMRVVLAAAALSLAAIGVAFSRRSVLRQARLSTCFRRTTKSASATSTIPRCPGSLLHLAGLERAAGASRSASTRILPTSRSPVVTRGRSRPTSQKLPEGEGGLQRKHQHFLQEDTHLSHPRCETEHSHLSRRQLEDHRRL